MNATEFACYCGQPAARFFVETMPDLTAGVVWYCDQCAKREAEAARAEAVRTSEIGGWNETATGL